MSKESIPTVGCEYSLSGALVLVLGVDEEQDRVTVEGWGGRMTLTLSQFHNLQRGYKVDTNLEGLLRVVTSSFDEHTFGVLQDWLKDHNEECLAVVLQHLVPLLGVILQKHLYMEVVPEHQYLASSSILVRWHLNVYWGKNAEKQPRKLIASTTIEAH